MGIPDHLTCLLRIPYAGQEATVTTRNGTTLVPNWERRTSRLYTVTCLFNLYPESVQFSSVQLLSHVQLFVTPWTAARQASLSNNSRSLLKLMSIDSGLPSNHLILCLPLLFSPSVFPSIRVFSNESVLHIRWPKYWSFSFNISPSSEYSGLIFFTYYLPGMLFTSAKLWWR